MRLPQTWLAYLDGRYRDFGLVRVLVPDVMREAEAREKIDATFCRPEGRCNFGG
jgi:2-keto-3-deoxy-L-rhamnonate aldolase RhmA